MALIASALRYGIQQSSLSDSVRLSRFLKTPLSSGSSKSFILAPKMLRHTLNFDGLRGPGRFSFSPSPSRFDLLWFIRLESRAFHAMNPLLPRCSLHVNSFDYYRLGNGLPLSYTYAVR
jgi:hypothetical protein